MGNAWTGKNVQLPVFLGEDQTPSATVCMARVFTDYERRGFFKLGVLPVLVADTVSFDLSRPTALSNALAVAQAWLRPPKAASQVEMRQVSFRLAPNSRPILEAGVLRCRPNGTCELAEGVAFFRGSDLLFLPNAILHIAGPQTGVVEWSEGSTRTFSLNLFEKPPLLQSAPQ